MLKKIRGLSEKGFTVIEIMIGIGLFGIIMPSIILAIVSVATLNDRAADITRANILAEQKIEGLRSAGFNALADEEVSFEPELDISFTKPRSAIYKITTPEAGVKEITVNISFTDNGSTRELSYRSQITELGVAQ